MNRTTAFFFDELCLWHSASSHVLVLPVGGWVQPPTGAGHSESPETMRRLKNLMDVSGLSSHLQQHSAIPVSEEALLRVHTADYLQRFKSLSDAGGGELGPSAPIGPGSYEIAKLSAGLTIGAVDVVLSGQVTNAYSLSRPPWASLPGGQRHGIFHAGQYRHRHRGGQGSAWAGQGRGSRLGRSPR